MCDEFKGTYSSNDLFDEQRLSQDFTSGMKILVQVRRQFLLAAFYCLENKPHRLYKNVWNKHFISLVIWNWNMILLSENFSITWGLLEEIKDFWIWLIDKYRIFLFPRLEITLNSDLTRVCFFTQTNQRFGLVFIYIKVIRIRPARRTMA